MSDSSITVVPMHLKETISGLDKLTNSLARRMRPDNIRDVLGWAAEAWLSCPPYRQAIIRGTSYFMTEVEVTAAGGKEDKVDEIELARKLMNDKFASKNEALLVLQEAMGFGGACVYFFIPLRRTLYCTESGCGRSMSTEGAMNDHSVKYNTKSFEYEGVCPDCGKKQEFHLEERPVSDAAQKSRLTRLPLSLCKMNYNPISGERVLSLDCANWDILHKGATEDNPLFHKDIPSEFLQAACGDYSLELGEDTFKYIGFSEASLVDMHMDGWSLPPFFYAFSDMIAILLLQQYNQTILKDYIQPLPYVSPPPTAGTIRDIGQRGSFDQVHASTSSVSDFRESVQGFIRNLKSSPGSIGIAPYPIQYGYLGLDGKQLLDVEMMQYYEDRLFYNMGIPPEFYRGGIQAQVAAPTHYGFELFEKFWKGLTDNLNDLYQWTLDRTRRLQRWPEMRAQLIPPTRYMSPELIMVADGLRREGHLTLRTYMRMVGFDSEYEKYGVQREQKDMNEFFMKDDMKMQRQQMVQSMLSEVSPQMEALNQISQAQMQSQAPAPAGGMPAGGSVISGAPPQGAPAGPVPPVEQAANTTEGMPGSAAMNPAQKQAMDALVQKAATQAETLLSMPDRQRKELLRALSYQAPVYHSILSSQLEELRQQLKNQAMDSMQGSPGM